MEYHAAYYDGDDGWIVAIVLDFPGANSQGKTLRSARRMIRDALRLMAQSHLEMGEALPRQIRKPGTIRRFTWRKFPSASACR